MNTYPPPTRSARRSSRLLAAVVLFLLLGLASAQVRVVNDLTHLHQVQPGDLLRGAIEVENRGAEPATVRVYRRDYRFEADGASHFPEPGTLPRSNAPWLRVFTPLATLAGGERAELVYEMQVPADADLAGTYWSLLMVEVQPPAIENATSGAQVREVVRYGVQVVAELPGAAAPELAFAEPALQRDDAGASRFELALANRGERRTQPAMTLELYSPEGALLQRVEAPTKTLYPDTSVRHRFELGALASGRYLALVIADGAHGAVAGQYTLDVKE